MAEEERNHLLEEFDEKHQDNDGGGGKVSLVKLSVTVNRRILSPAWIIAIISLLCNVALIVQLVQSRSGSETLRSGGDCRSQFAGLTYEKDVPIYSSTQYGPAIGTQKERDELWRKLDISDGTITLSDDFATDNGLPRSMRFVWNQTQGVYQVGAFHQIHCLRKIQKYTSDAEQGRPQTESYKHIEHCLDALLQDVYCHADDTPWYQLPSGPSRKNYEPFQTRRCKDWSRLLSWVSEHNACYKHEVFNADGSPNENNLEHYTYCPDESPYKEKMEAYVNDENRAR